MKKFEYTYSISVNSLRYEKENKKESVDLKEIENHLKRIDFKIEKYLKEIEIFAKEISNEYYAEYVSNIDIKLDLFTEKIKNLSYKDGFLEGLEKKLNRIEEYILFIEESEEDLFEKYDVILEYIQQIPEIIHCFIVKNTSDNIKFREKCSKNRKTEEIEIVKVSFIEDKKENVHNKREKIKTAS